MKKSWKKYTIKSVNFFLATTLLLGVVTSCGKRTTSLSKVNIKKDSLSVENNRILKQNIVLNDIYQIRPFDPLKPIVIDGKYYYNAIINFDKSIAYNGVEKNISNLSYTGVSEKEKAKVTEKSDPTIMYIGIAFVICLFIFLWFYLPKIPSKL